MKVISFINMKGGVGKSTMATNLAQHLYERLGQRVLMVDIDPLFNATQGVINTVRYVNHMKIGG
ncbi:ParA family protein, partial [Klebsiella pneumoniae]|uniref:ParA family protein n=1 Tax=Klebsiella pneumoniae TaxID=573 RepID=UPI002DB85425